MNKRTKYRNVWRVWLILGFIVLSISGCYWGGSRSSSDYLEEEGVIHTPSTSDSTSDDTDDAGDTITLEEAIEKRSQENQVRQEEEGEFYVPLSSISSLNDLNPTPKDVDVKGLYVTGNIAGLSFDESNIDLYSDYIRYKSGEDIMEVSEDQVASVNRLEKILAICQVTEINALVIDVKDDQGQVMWDSDIPIVNTIGSDTNAPWLDYEKLLSYLEKHDIYTIARIVSFKDPILAAYDTAHDIQEKDIGVYVDNDESSWVNPFDTYVWQYLIAISKEAALRGFDEVEYAYMRFPEIDDDADVYYPGRQGLDKDQDISYFLEYAKESLDDYGVNVTSDIIGDATGSWDDPTDIGQTWREVATMVDSISPQIFPSSYAEGVYGLDKPESQPYELILSALEEAWERNSAQENPGGIRPWIQAYTASEGEDSVTYESTLIQEELQAVYDADIDEYMLWNPSSIYDPLSFYYDRGDEDSIEEVPSVARDEAGRTPTEAIERYMDAKIKGIASRMYLLTPKSDRASDYETYEALVLDAQTSGQDLAVDYSIRSYSQLVADGERYSFKLQVTKSNGASQQATYIVLKEDGVYKVKDYTLIQATDDN